MSSDEIRANTRQVGLTNGLTVFGRLQKVVMNIGIQNAIKNCCHEGLDFIRGLCYNDFSYDKGAKMPNRVTVMALERALQEIREIAKKPAPSSPVEVLREWENIILIVSDYTTSLRAADKPRKIGTSPGYMEVTSLDRFIQERCRTGTNDRTPIGALHGLYSKWVHKQGQTAISKIMFGKILVADYHWRKGRSSTTMTCAGQAYVVGSPVWEGVQYIPEQENGEDTPE